MTIPLAVPVMMLCLTTTEADNNDMLTKAADEITALRAKVKAQDKALNGALERLAQISAGQINQTYTSPAALLAWAQEVAFTGFKEGRAAQEAGHE